MDLIFTSLQKLSTEPYLLVRTIPHVAGYYRLLAKVRVRGLAADGWWSSPAERVWVDESPRLQVPARGGGAWGESAAQNEVGTCALEWGCMWVTCGIAHSSQRHAISHSAERESNPPGGGSRDILPAPPTPLLSASPSPRKVGLGGL